MGVIAEGILRGCQGLFTPVSLGYPLSVFNKNSTLKQINFGTSREVLFLRMLDQFGVLFIRVGSLPPGS